MEDQKKHLTLPPNYVTIFQLKQRWLQKKEQEAQNRDPPQEIQLPEVGEISEEKSVMEEPKAHTLAMDSKPRNLHPQRNPSYNRNASVNKQRWKEASGEMPEKMVVEVKVDGCRKEGSEKEENGINLDDERKTAKKHKKKKKSVIDGKNPKSEEEATEYQNFEVAEKHKKHLPDINDKEVRRKEGSEKQENGINLDDKRKTAKKPKKKNTSGMDGKNPKSEEEATEYQNFEVAEKHKKPLPEFNDKEVRTRGRNTGEDKGIEDEYGPNSGNADQTMGIERELRHFSINDEIRRGNNRFVKNENGIHQGYRNSGVNRSLNRPRVQKEKGPLVWMRKGSVSNGVSDGLDSGVAGRSSDGPPANRKSRT